MVMAIGGTEFGVEFLGPFLEQFKNRFLEIKAKHPRKSPEDIYKMTYRDLGLVLGLAENQTLFELFGSYRVNEMYSESVPGVDDRETPLQHRPSMPARRHSSELDRDAIEYARERASD